MEPCMSESGSSNNIREFSLVGDAGVDGVEP